MEGEGLPMRKGWMSHGKAVWLLVEKGGDINEKGHGFITSAGKGG